MTRIPQGPDSEEWLVDKPVAQTSRPVRHWRVQDSFGQKSTCSCISSTPESTFRATRCHSQVWLVNKTEPTWSPSSSKTHDAKWFSISDILWSLIISSGIFDLYILNESVEFIISIKEMVCYIDLIFDIGLIDWLSSFIGFRYLNFIKKITGV